MDCYVCGEAFTWGLGSNPRHHCRQCGRSVCATHSAHTAVLAHFGDAFTGPQRVCNNCYTALDASRRAALHRRQWERDAWGDAPRSAARRRADGVRSTPVAVRGRGRDPDSPAQRRTAAGGAADASSYGSSDMDSTRSRSTALDIANQGSDEPLVVKKKKKKKKKRKAAASAANSPARPLNNLAVGTPDTSLAGGNAMLAPTGTSTPRKPPYRNPAEILAEQPSLVSQVAEIFETCGPDAFKVLDEWGVEQFPAAKPPPEPAGATAALPMGTSTPILTRKTIPGAKNAGHGSGR